MEKVIAKARLKPTSAATSALLAAAMLAKFKEADQHVISASGILFAAIQMEEQKLIYAETKDYELDALSMVRYAFVGDNKIDVYKELISTDFYKTIPTRWEDTQPLEEAVFSNRMNQGISELNGSLDVVDLFLIALTSPGEFLARRLLRLKIDTEALTTEIYDLKFNSFKAGFRRERRGGTRARCATVCARSS
jgi:hypothetical protein